MRSIILSLIFIFCAQAQANSNSEPKNTLVFLSAMDANDTFVAVGSPADEDQLPEVLMGPPGSMKEYAVTNIDVLDETGALNIYLENGQVLHYPSSLTPHKSPSLQTRAGLIGSEALGLRLFPIAKSTYNLHLLGLLNDFQADDSCSYHLNGPGSDFAETMGPYGR